MQWQLHSFATALYPSLDFEYSILPNYVPETVTDSSVHSVFDLTEIQCNVSNADSLKIAWKRTVVNNNVARISMRIKSDAHD